MARSKAPVAAALALACICTGAGLARLSAAAPSAGPTASASVARVCYAFRSMAASPSLSVALKDPQGRLVDPFLAAENSAAIVFLFASVDCPVSNRYAPEVQRLHAAFAAQNVAFWLVYPNPSDTPEAVRDHLAAFSYPVHALLDPGHDLVKLAKASITPEAAVFNRTRTLVYHGRIDDRFVSLGVERPAATRRDLFDALTAVRGRQGAD